MTHAINKDIITAYNHVSTQFFDGYPWMQIKKAGNTKELIKN